jgi:hypothetical protein
VKLLQALGGTRERRAFLLMAALILVVFPLTLGNFRLNLVGGQQGVTGGVNGITDLKTLHGWDAPTRPGGFSTSSTRCCCWAQSSSARTC